MIPVAVIGLLVLLFAILSWIAYWRGLRASEAAELRSTFRERLGAISSLLLLLFIPALGILLWAVHLYALVFPVALLWGIVAMLLWERGIVPLPSVAPLFAPLPPLPGAPTRPPFSPAPGEEPGKGDTVRLRYAWSFRPSLANALDVPQEISLAISKERYQRYHEAWRSTDSATWALLVTEDMPEVRELAVKFYELHLKQNWSTVTQADNILAFIHANIAYEADMDGQGNLCERAKYPIETLREQRGDCEDTAILAAAILKRMGFEAALLLYPGHCALGVGGADSVEGEYAQDPRSGIRYFYGETTAEGWYIGQVPEAHRGQEVRIVPIQLVITPDETEPDDVDLPPDEEEEEDEGLLLPEEFDPDEVFPPEQGPEPSDEAPLTGEEARPGPGQEGTP